MPLSDTQSSPRYRDTNANLRTQLLRIIASGPACTPWPKLFQNLRASRATELAAEYPGHVAADGSVTARPSPTSTTGK